MAATGGDVPKVDEATNVFASPAEFVKASGGTTCINRLLICNNGIAAVKCIRSIRRWSYEVFGNDRAIEFVVMVTPEDMQANAEFVRLADYHIEAMGGANNHNYANVDFIIKAAKRMKVQAVWAGWGHCSENPALPDGLAAAGIAFLGPPGHAMRSLGDKISSMIVAESSDVPQIPWSGSGLKIDTDTCRNPVDHSLVVPRDIYLQGCVETAAEGLASAQKIGFPVMIKASEGGGGKGIRKVTEAESFATLFRQVQAEVPGSPIFIMQLASGARHLEVQLLADQHGQCIALHGRDCSVQRRHQKIIEEGPAAIAPRTVFDKMEKAAIRLGKLVGYVSAGTVEFLFSEDHSFAFLELNPRLQVEHPCSELITGVNLPAAQLQIAMGIPLHRIADIRHMYGYDNYGTSAIPFDKAVLGTPADGEIAKPSPIGHVIACRITAENPDEGFKPSSGTVTEINFRTSPDVWGYFSVHATGGLHEFADSQFGHIFSHGKNREHARRSMVLALKELSIRAEFRTTTEYLIKLVETNDFRANQYTTQWLDGLIANKMKAERPLTDTAVICGSLHIADRKICAAVDEYSRNLAIGHVLPVGALKQMTTLEIIYEESKYSLEAHQTGAYANGACTYVLYMNGAFIEVFLHRLTDGGSLIRIMNADGTTESKVVYMREEVESYVVSVGGKTCVFDKENDPTIMRASSAGKLVRYLVEDGEHVKTGQAFAEVEVMKMVMSVHAKASGCIQHVQLGGAILASGNLIATMKLDNPDQVKTATPFTGVFPGATTGGDKPPGEVHEQFKTAHTFCFNVLRGFALPAPVFKTRLATYLDLLMLHSSSREVPLLEARIIIATLNGRIPAAVEASIVDELGNYERSTSSIICKFPTQRLAMIIDAHATTLDSSDQNAFFLTVLPLQDLIQQFRLGTNGRFVSLVTMMINEYLEIEGSFLNTSLEEAADKLKASAGGDLKAVVDAIIAHTQLANKNHMMIEILERIFTAGQTILKGNGKGANQDAMLFEALEKLARLTAAPTAPVALKARQFLIQLQCPEFDTRRKDLEATFTDLQSPEPVENLVKQGTSVFDVLSEFFYHENPVVQQSALEVYVRRAYVAYEIRKITFIKVAKSNNVVVWQYRIPSLSSDDVEGRTRRKSIDATSPDAGSEGLMKRVVSIQNLTQMGGESADPSRLGVMAGFQTMEELEAGFTPMLENLQTHDEDSNEPINVVNVALTKAALKADATDDMAIVKELTSFVMSRRDELYAWQIRRITFLIVLPEVFPKIFTFRESASYAEDAIYRHIDPALAFKLELGRLKNYTVKLISSTAFHVYNAVRKSNGEVSTSRAVENRFFCRMILRDFEHDEAGDVSIQATGDKLLLSVLDELEILASDDKYGKSDSNHIFINVVPVLDVAATDFEADICKVIRKHKTRMWKLRVLEAEIRVNVRSVRGEEYAMRLVISNPLGYYMNLEWYRESHAQGPRTLVYESCDLNKKGPFHGQSCVEPYAPQDKAQEVRSSAHSMRTTYVHDYVELMREALKESWDSVIRSSPKTDAPRTVLTATELALDASENLVPVRQGTKPNRVGMLAWQITAFTPTAPGGRDIILIANDITHVIGSFGPKEDIVFNQASKLARERGIPRVYISANSGARIGLAQEVMAKFKVAWENPENPAKGFKFLYVSPEDYAELVESGSIEGEPVKVNGEPQYKITDIIGAQDGLGVECLRGSGMIAGETSRAYSETFTITLVSCRSVGIGAYLVRLGQRAVQADKSHIILTGAGTLNKVLGKDVYTSNLQLGGPQIMYNNGVSHMKVSGDFEGMKAILHWISYVPIKAGVTPPAPTPFTLDLADRWHSLDPVDRDVGFYPPKGQYDPRCLIAGDPRVPSATGLFDTGSFTEMLGGWAKTVVTGRARLGGIPVGVIAVETRPIELVTPADPANMDSVTQVSVQAGQVWYPNSAYKTATAIKDIDNEKLPLFILANWRGFSGGMRDMYDEVLKFGSMIVDNLHTFKQPIFIYLPPFAELRGGAWVVVDPTINANMIEMYADTMARGGVLEAEGTVEIKFRKKAVVVVMARLDPPYRELLEKLKGASAEEAAQIKQAMDKRYELLAPMYHQIAVSFADMHDTPVRMKAKGCISDVIPWKDSRRFFAQRLRSRMYTEHVLAEIAKANPTTTYKQRKLILRRWFFEVHDQKQHELFEDAKVMVPWIEGQLTPAGTLKGDSQLAANIVHLREEFVVDKVTGLANGDSTTSFQCVSALVGNLSEAQRKELVAALK